MSFEKKEPMRHTAWDESAEWTETTVPASPLAQLGEDDQARITRLLEIGTAHECLMEANYWLDYYLNVDCDLEPVTTAMRLNERACSLLETTGGSNDRERETTI